MPAVDRVVIVTGGGSGIGQAAAIEFAQRGSAVAVVGRTLEKLESTVRTIKEHGGAAMAVVADMGDPDAPRKIVDAVVAAWGRIDALVNNAAHIKHMPFEQFSIEDFDRHFAVNVRGPFLLSQAVMPYLRKGTAPAIVMVSSGSAVLCVPGQACYATSKAALEYLTRSLAAEYAPTGIRVNCLSPGSADTPIHLVWAADDLEGAYRRMTAEIPMKRMGTAQEIGHWIVELASPEAGYITGDILRVDGGITLPGAASKIVAD